MSENWTKGPWTTGYTYPDGYTVVTVFNADGDEICNMGNTLLDEQAHADFIAAAPKLWDALAALVEHDEHLIECEVLKPFVELEHAKAILNKARGEA